MSSLESAQTVKSMVIEKTPNSSGESITFLDVVDYFIYFLMFGGAIYYGWKIGMSHSVKFWITVQVIGAKIGQYIRSSFAQLQATARRSR